MNSSPVDRSRSTLTPNLADCWLRLRRGDEHIQQLQSEFDGLPDEAKAVLLRQEFDAQENRIRILVARVPQYPAHWPILISETLFHLRAALDHLVWQLASWNLKQRGEARNPDDRTQFPIARDEAGFAKARYMWRDMHPDHVALIAALQPYGDGFVKAERARYPHASLEALVASHPLTILRHLNNADKHRTLTLVAASGGRVRFGPISGYLDCAPPLGGESWTNIILEFHEGEEWVSFNVTPTGPNPAVVASDRIAPELSVGGGHQILRVLPAIRDAVDNVLGHF